MRLHKLAAILQAMIRHVPAPALSDALLRLVLPHVSAGCGLLHTPSAVGVRWPASLLWCAPQMRDRHQTWVKLRRVEGRAKAGKPLGGAGA